MINIDEYACAYAAREGHLDCLKYLHETAKAPWDAGAVLKAHENNHPECVQYLLDNNCPLTQLAIRRRNFTRLINTHDRERERERERERDKKHTFSTTTTTAKRDEKLL